MKKIILFISLSLLAYNSQGQISATPVNCGTDSTTGLEKYRQFIVETGDMERNIITVWYYEWLQTATGAQVNKQKKSYFIENSASWINKAGQTIPADTSFTEWYNLLGRTYIIPAINATLQNEK